MNYNLECEKILDTIDLDHKPTLLLHSCCAPCSSAVLERISKYFSITILFYNPNITDYEEYLKRKEELKQQMQDRFKIIDEEKKYQYYAELDSELKAMYDEYKNL